MIHEKLIWEENMPKIWEKLLRQSIIVISRRENVNTNSINIYIAVTLLLLI